MPNQDQGLTELYAREINRQLYDRAIAAAEALGPPPNKTALTSEQEYQFYWLADPSVDVMDLVANQGLTPEEATLKKYPHRATLLVSGKPKLVDRVAYATRMLNLHEERQARSRDDNKKPETPMLQEIESSIGLSEPTVAPPTIEPELPTEAPMAPDAGMAPLSLDQMQSQGVI